MQYPNTKVVDQALLYLAEATMGDGLYEEAAKKFRKVYNIDLNPETQRTAAYGLGACFFELKQYDEAKNWLTHAINLTDNASDYRLYTAYFMAPVMRRIVKPGIEIMAALPTVILGFLAGLWLAPLIEANLSAVIAIAIVLPIIALTAINIVGVRFGVNTGVLLVLGKLLPLAIFVAVGIFAVSRSMAAGQEPLAGGGLGQAALLLLFAYAGFENTAAAAGEFKNPRRDVPFALLVEIGFVTLLYVAVQWVALGTVPNLGSSETPLADGARIFLGHWGGWLLTAGAVVSILGTNSNSVLAGPRYLFALAHDGFGPKFLASVHPRFRTPAAAILFQSAIALPLALSGSFVGLATLSVVARLTAYVATTTAVPVLRRRQNSQSSFKLPGGIAIPAAATVVSLGLLASASWANLLAGAAALAVGGLIYGFRREVE